MAIKQNNATVRRPQGKPRLQPLYHQVYVQLRHLLTEHPLDPDQPLPAEPALAARYGVSRVTIRKTLEQLQRDGLITRVHGKGTYPAKVMTAQEKTNISSVLDNLLSFDARTSAVTLSWEMVSVEPKLAHQLDSPRCLRVVRLRRMDGQPLSFTTVHVPERLAPYLDRDQIGSEPVVQALERQGIISERADQVISAVTADAEAAEALEISEGVPLMVMRRLMFDAGHRPVLHQESCYPADRFEYRMTLSRLSVGPVGQWAPIS